MQGLLEGITLSIPFAMVAVGAFFTGKHVRNLKDNKLLFVWRISMVVAAVTSFSLVGTWLAGVKLPDVWIRVVGVLALASLPVVAFTTVKLYFTKKVEKQEKQE